MFNNKNKGYTTCQMVRHISLSTIKYLGILLDSQLTYKNQINALRKKVSRAIGVSYKLRPFITSKTLISVYYAIIYPFLLYGIVLWGNVSTT